MGERGERVVETTHAYADGDPVRIRVRKRGCGGLSQARPVPVSRRSYFTEPARRPSTK